ncbi:MAG: hypothetical protein IKY57_02030 [Alistipes sp.]|nr:hypothetical protein [Alistipes sp.]
MMKKVCIVCGQELPIEQFPENRRMPDGHLGWCFECFALRTWKPKQHQIEPVAEEPTPEEQPAPVEPSKPKRSPKVIRRYKRSEESKERNRIRARQYYYEHRERCIANQRRYRQTEQGRKRKAEHMRAYRKTEKYQAWLKARNAQRREAYAQKRLERQ